MSVSEATHRGTRVRLPRDLTRPFEVFVNGVEQVEGTDFELDGRTLLFHRELKSEGKLGFWRWTSIFVGVAGTYRQDDSVDVVYERGGRRVVATKLPHRARLRTLRRAIEAVGSVGRWKLRTGSRSRISYASTGKDPARSTGSTFASRRVRSTASSDRTAPGSRPPSTS